MTRTQNAVFILMLAAAAAAGCGSDGMPAPGSGQTCEPLATASCYTGPALASGVGACSMGSMVCDSDGSAYGECSGSVLPSFQGCASGVDTDCDGATACSGAHRWSQGLIGRGFKAPFDVGVDKDGNIALAGSFEDALDLGGGELQADTSLAKRDVFIGRFGATGEHLWSKKLGDAADQVVYGFASDRDGNVIVTGYSETAITFEGATLKESFLLKLGPDGELLWSLPDTGYMAVDGEGNIILAGGFEGTLNYGDKALTSNGERDVYISKFDPSGELLWAVSAGGAGSEYLHQVAVDGAGNIAVAGQYSGDADIGSGPLEPGTNDTNQRAFVAKFDKDGAFQWSRGYSGDYVRIRVLSADNAGNTVFTAFLFGPVDFGGGHVEGEATAVLTKLDQSGETLFVERYFGEPSSEYAHSAYPAGVAFDAEDNMLVVGQFDRVTDLGEGFALKDNGPAVFVAKYDPQGKVIWGMTPGGGYAFDGNVGISADPLGGVVVTGTYDSWVDFGGGALYGNPDQTEIFLARLGP
jgi:hypothetical protein